MNKGKATVLLLSVAGQATVLPLSALAAGNEGISLQRMVYSESDDRMSVDYTQVALNKDFGTDFSFSVSGSIDAMTGATPAVDAKTGASNYANSDGFLLSEGISDPSGYERQLFEMEDERKAVNSALTWRTAKRHEWTGGLSYSEEEDYESRGFSVEHLHNLHPSRNRTLSVGYSQLENDVLFYRENVWRDATYQTVEVGLTEVLSRTSLVKVSVFGMQESGALSNPYKRIIRKVNIAQEGDTPVFLYFLSPDSRPDERDVAGIDVKGVKRVEWRDTPVTQHLNYRFYSDTWGVNSHTLESKTYLGSPDVGLGQWFAGLRYMIQDAASFYFDDDAVFDVSGFGSVDKRLSDFNDVTVSLGWERSIAQHWRVQARGSYQTQSVDLDMTWAWLGVKYAF